MPHHRSSGRPEWEEQTSKLLSDAREQPSAQVPWTPSEDSVLLRLLVTWSDLQEWQMKMAGCFESECKIYRVSPPAKREYLDIIQRLDVLQHDHRKYSITLHNASERLFYYHCGSNERLWEDKDRAASSSRAPQAATSRQDVEEEEESESDEDEVVEVVKIKKKKQTKVVEVEESEDDEEDEEGAEEETNTGHDRAEHRVEGEGASQQQATQTNAAASTNSQDNSSRGTKREPTLLLEAGGKRIRIGIPPKGTKVKCYPEHGSIELKF